MKDLTNEAGNWTGRKSLQKNQLLQTECEVFGIPVGGQGGGGEGAYATDSGSQSCIKCNKHGTALSV